MHYGAANKENHLMIPCFREFFYETYGRITNLPAKGSDVGIEPFLGRLEDALPFSLYATSDLG